VANANILAGTHPDGTRILLDATHQAQAIRIVLETVKIVLGEGSVDTRVLAAAVEVFQEQGLI
jgi:hypothetical protein